MISIKYKLQLSMSFPVSVITVSVIVPVGMSTYLYLPSTNYNCAYMLTQPNTPTPPLLLTRATPIGNQYPPGNSSSSNPLPPTHLHFLKKKSLLIPIGVLAPLACIAIFYI